MKRDQCYKNMLKNIYVHILNNFLFEAKKKRRIISIHVLINRTGVCMKEKFKMAIKN